MVNVLNALLGELECRDECRRGQSPFKSIVLLDLPDFLRRLLRIEGFRVERTSPFQHLVVLPVLRITQGREVIGVDPRPATIFRCAGLLTFDTERVFHLGIVGREAFKYS